MKPSLVIFDLDGTLSDARHRQHLVAGPKRNFDAFYRACDQDLPMTATIMVAQSLHAVGLELWLFSGRSDAVLGRTLDWMSRYGIAHIFTKRRFRNDGDYMPDDKLKKEWYEQMSDEDRARLLVVFDDRDRLVAMWRGLGVPCFQVAPGNF